MLRPIAHPCLRDPKSWLRSSSSSQVVESTMNIWGKMLFCDN
jgi:hypothetical protein